MVTKYVTSYGGTIPFTEVCAQTQLSVNNVQTYTVPGTNADGYIATFRIRSDVDVYVGYNATPTLPSANSVTTQSSVELINPGNQYYVRGATVLSFLTPEATAYVTVSLRAYSN